MFRKTLFAMLSGAAAVAAHAGEAMLSLEIPRLQVAEYHNPYVAIWTRADGSGDITNLALWYQMDDKGEGEKWLKDLRQWWRRSGRSLEMPADGFTGATRKPGKYSVNLGQALAALPAGPYTIYVEASREVGGRELITLPLILPISKPETIAAQGGSELGAVSLTVEP